MFPYVVSVSGSVPVVDFLSHTHFFVKAVLFSDDGENLVQPGVIIMIIPDVLDTLALKIIYSPECHVWSGKGHDFTRQISLLKGLTL